MCGGSQQELTVRGFQGFRTADDLRATSLTSVPSTQGVYCVLRVSTTSPQFLSTNPGGKFKGRDPTQTEEWLVKKWIVGATILYIGKAGGGSSRETLKRRLRSYLNFGAGRPCAHWGGRSIWQLADAKDLLFAWRETLPEDAVAVERSMLLRFKREFNRLPFANLRK